MGALRLSDVDAESERKQIWWEWEEASMKGWWTEFWKVDEAFVFTFFLLQINSKKIINI